MFFLLVCVGGSNIIAYFVAWLVCEFRELTSFWWSFFFWFLGEVEILIIFRGWLNFINKGQGLCQKVIYSLDPLHYCWKLRKLSSYPQK